MVCPDDKNLKLHIDGRMLYKSGIGRCLREILKEITNIGKEIIIQLYGNRDDYIRYLKSYPIPEESISFWPNNSPIYSLGEQVRGSLLNLRAKQNEVFYYPHYNLPFIVHEKSVLTIHDFIQFRFPEYFGRKKVWMARRILNNSVKKAKRVIVDSISTEKDFYEYFPYYRGKVKVIYNGVSKNFRILKNKKRNDFINRKRLDKYILFIGNNKPHKNIYRLIDSYIQVRDRYPDLKLVIISSGFNIETIKTKREIKEDILVIERADEEELVWYYNLANMLVLPSFYEGFGLPIIEAMACGCPVITSNISSMPEIGGDAACYIDPYDHKSIINGIMQIMDNKSMKNDLIEKGIKRSKSFTWGKTAENYIKVFRDVI